MTILDSRNSDSLKVPFLKKVQSTDQNIDSLEISNSKNNLRTTELNSHRQSTKPLSLHTKGPIIIHNRSLALGSNHAQTINYPYSNKNSSLIHNKFSMNFMQEKDKIKKNAGLMMTK